MDRLLSTRSIWSAISNQVDTKTASPQMMDIFLISYSFIWEEQSVGPEINATFTINICGNVDACSGQTSVCRRTGNSAPENIGSYVTPLNMTENTTRGEVWLNMTGDVCPTNDKERSRSIITFRCGKTLVGIIPLF